VVSYVPHERAAARLAQLGVALSGAMVRRPRQAVGARTQAREQAEHTAVYAAGASPAAGTERAAPLFVEGDGVLIPLQRAAARRAELKVALSYRGTQSVAVAGGRRVGRRLSRASWPPAARSTVPARLGG
jgi:hypothetical protein